MARLEAIKLFLVYTAHQRFKVYQMDVKSIFLNGILGEEVYVEQPLSFEEDDQNKVCKLHKVVYRLKQ